MTIKSAQKKLPETKKLLNRLPCGTLFQKKGCRSSLATRVLQDPYHHAESHNEISPYIHTELQNSRESEIAKYTYYRPKKEAAEPRRLYRVLFAELIQGQPQRDSFWRRAKQVFFEALEKKGTAGALQE